MMSYLLTLIVIIALHGGTAYAEDPKKPGTPGRPRSMEDVGYHATLLYLQRAERSERSKTGARGHYHVPLAIGGST